MNGGSGFVVGQNDLTRAGEKGETRRLWSEARSGFGFLFSGGMLPQRNVCSLKDMNWVNCDDVY